MKLALGKFEVELKSNDGRAANSNIHHRGNAINVAAVTRWFRNL